MSYARSINNDNIEEGLDRKNLSLLEKRFLSINEARLQRTRSALSHQQQLFLDLLPLFLHTNHPMMPGYLSHSTPAGISNYQPSKHELKVAANCVRSFRYNEVKARAQSISAIFIMGSVGTVAYSSQSDLDVWVCYHNQLDRAEVSQLEGKCLKLGRFAQQWGLETHFFVMSDTQLRAGKSLRMDTEASGNAQHILLLDEFYRSSILLAGRMPLWWFVPAGSEGNYSRYSQLLLERRYLPAAKVLDFGPVNTIPAGEFIGAGIWQLYKAIESPYKSLLKLVLLEVYASEYPRVNTLALQLKQLVYDDQQDIDELDPYVIAYRKIERYLQKQGDNDRLQLVRRCFYFKVHKRLTRSLTSNHKSWQRGLLEKLVGEWGWTKKQLAILDNRQNWKAYQVLAERKALVNELNKTYQYLLAFAQKINPVLAISRQEITVLGRKLNASFEKRNGKIDWINPHIAPDIAEEYLCFVEDYNPSLHSTQWKVYPQSGRSYDEKRVPHIKGREQLVELLLWCHCNEILTAGTRYDLRTRDGRSIEVEPLLAQLRQWLPLPLATPPHDAFEQPAHTVKMLIAVNVAHEPYRELMDSGLHQLSDTDDIFNHASAHNNLVMSLDVISINNWNEVEIVHFHRDAVLQLLRYCLRVAPAGNPLPEFTIECSTPGYGHSIRQRLEELLSSFGRCYYSPRAQRSSRFIFSMADCHYCAQVRDPQLEIAELNCDEHLMQHLALPQTQFSPVVFEGRSHAPNLIKLLYSVGSGACIKVAYQTQGNRAKLYVIDEQGSLFTHDAHFTESQLLLRPLHRFIRSAIGYLNLRSNDNSYGVYPVSFYHYTNHQLVQVHITTELSKLPGFEVQARAQVDATGDLSWTLCCDDRVFEQGQLGKQVFRQAAQHMISLRNSGIKYPCYITDLDLSRCQALASPYQLQLSHFLSLKSHLEFQLNSALHL